MKLPRISWILVSGFAMISALIGLKVWSQRPPFEFMHGARLVATDTNPLPPLSGNYIEAFLIDRPSIDVCQSAVRELGLPQFNWGDEMEFFGRRPGVDVFIEKFDQEQGATDRERRELGWTKITICYTEQPTWSRMRALMHGL